MRLNAYFCGMDKMKPKVEIDPAAGFCSGVKRAISASEDLLKETELVYCLGEMVHNEAELKRLEDKGLHIATPEILPELKPATVIIRTHGEPPHVYNHVIKSGHKLADATCPVVLRLQQRVKLADAEMQKKGGLVVIYGKAGHPEVVGLQGQINGRVVVISSPEFISEVDCSVPLRVFAQTTADESGFQKFTEELVQLVNQTSKEKADIEIYHSICRQMSRRGPAVENFARTHDVLIFVSGSESSNGKYLAAIARTANAATYIVSGMGQLKTEWFVNAKTIGVSGATSTPDWLMKQVADEINALICY